MSEYEDLTTAFVKALLMIIVAAALMVLGGYVAWHGIYG